jgi:GINS complex subunit 3
MSYYDIDAILTDAQKVPCTFELTVPGLGYVEGNMSGDMKQGSKVELPLWLGEMLALRYTVPSSCMPHATSYKQLLFTLLPASP